MCAAPVGITAAWHAFFSPLFFVLLHRKGTILFSRRNTDRRYPTYRNLPKLASDVSYCHKQSLDNAPRTGSNAGSYCLRNCIPYAPATTTPFGHHRVDDFTGVIALPGTTAISSGRHTEKYDSSALPNDAIAARKTAPQQRFRKDIPRLGIRNGSATGHAP